MKEPKDVTVFASENAEFPCAYNGTYQIPTWIVNNTYYQFPLLPRDHYLHVIEDGVQLYVPNVQTQINTTSYQCAFLNMDIRSAIGILYVGKL